MGGVLVHVADTTYVQIEVKCICWRDGIFIQWVSHLQKTNLMYNLSSVYLVKHLCMFRAYL